MKKKCLTVFLMAWVISAILMYLLKVKATLIDFIFLPTIYGISYVIAFIIVTRYIEKKEKESENEHEHEE